MHPSSPLPLATHGTPWVCTLPPGWCQGDAALLPTVSLQLPEEKLQPLSVMSLSNLSLYLCLLLTNFAFSPENLPDMAGKNQYAKFLRTQKNITHGYTFAVEITRTDL